MKKTTEFILKIMEATKKGSGVKTLAREIFNEGVKTNDLFLTDLASSLAKSTTGDEFSISWMSGAVSSWYEKVVASGWDEDVEALEKAFDENLEDWRDE